MQLRIQKVELRIATTQPSLPLQWVRMCMPSSTTSAGKTDQIEISGLQEIFELLFDIHTEAKAKVEK